MGSPTSNLGVRVGVLCSRSTAVVQNGMVVKHVVLKGYFPQVIRHVNM